MPDPIAESMALAMRSRNDQTGHDEIYGPVTIVERWHNDTHPGAFMVCSEQPCHAINWALRPRPRYDA